MSGWAAGGRDAPAFVEQPECAGASGRPAGLCVACGRAGRRGGRRAGTATAGTAGAAAAALRAGALRAGAPGRGRAGDSGAGRLVGNIYLILPRYAPWRGTAALMPR